MSRSLSRQLLRCLILAASISCVTDTVAQDVPKKTIMEMTEDERHNLTVEMQRVIDDAMVGAHFFSEDPLPIHVEVSVDPETNLVVLNVDERLGPDALTGEFDDFDSHLTSALWPLLEKIDGVTGIDFRFGGFDADHWPINRTPEASTEGRRQRRSADRNPLVFVSPGHGFYFHHKYKDWRAQREIANGVLEDDITPILAGHLMWELQRDNVNVKTIRYEGDRLSHKPSGEAWWRIAARYHLEKLYPDLTSVWRSEGKGGPLRERDEDIRSRPLYANHLKADALLHIHTNADASSAPNGLRTYINGRSEDHELAAKILCSARELIHVDGRFKDFAVSQATHVNARHAENRLAKMPSVIVEVGFHTNPEDAEFLKEREFQVLAMRGVAKGYRLFRNKLPCEDFAINPVEEVPGRINRFVELPLRFTGNPRFPVTVWSKKLNCSGPFCHDQDYWLSSQERVEQLKILYMCRSIPASGVPNDEGATIELEITARDYDGVLAKPTIYHIACPKKQAARASGG